MQNKKKTIRRLTVLYVLFFIVIATSIVLSFNATAFNEGFMTGMSDAQRMFEDKGAGNKVSIFYDMRPSTGYMDFNMPIFESADSSIAIKARPSRIDVEAISPGMANHFRGTGLAMFFSILSLLTYGAIFIIIFLILTSLRKSIRTDDVFDRSNIVMTRVIAVLLIVGSLLFSFASWIECRSIAPFFEGSGYAINTSFPFNFSELIMGIIVLFVAEVFAIGTSLSEEQKLTI